MTAASPDDLPDVFTAELVRHLQSLKRGSTEAEDDPTHELFSGDLRERLERAKRCLTVLQSVARETRIRASAPHSLESRASSYGPLSHPKTIGRFEISRVLGIGGFGIVYKAYDPRTRREVAVKVPRLEVLASGSMLRRFEQEAAAAGKLEHPNIVAVLEAGADGPVPYLVMPYHTGPTLAAWLAKRSGPPSRAWSAGIVQQLADALEYAHNHGVLHRDVKPSNVLLTSIDEGASPDDEPGAAPRLMDFGLAKVADSVGEQTRTGTILGTVRYMAPEQAAGGHGVATRSSDVYSLGAVLYQLLTGRVPFEGPTEVETLRRIASDDPAPIPRGRTMLERDVAVVCMKCLEKDPNRRYRSAAELSEDLGRALAGKIIRARSASVLERTVKLVRRYPLWAALVGLATAGTVGLVCETLYHNAQLRTALEQSRASETTAKRHAYAADMRGLLERLHVSRPEAIRPVLEVYVPGPGEVDVRGFEWHVADRYLRMDQPATELARHAGGVSGAAISPDGSVGASAGQDGIVHVWKLVDRTKAGELHGHALGAVDGLEFSPDGGLLASGGEDGTIRLWDATSLAPRWVVSGHGDWVASVAFSPDGERLASGGGDGRVRVWNVVDGALVQEFEGHEDTVRSVAFDLKRPALYSASEDKTIRVWDLEKGGPSSLVEGGVLDRRDDRWVRKLVIEPDGASLLEVFFNRGCAYFELGAATFGKIREISGLEGNSRAAAIFFNQDGHSCIAYGLEEGAIHLGRHERNFHVSRALLGHDAQVNSLAASSDGRFLLSGDSQGRVLLWDLRRPTGVVREWSPPNFAAWAVLTLDGETLLFRSIPGTTVGAFDIRSFAVMREWDGGDGAEIGVASPDGRFLVEHGWKGGIVVHSVDEGRVLHRLALKEGARAVLILEGDPIAAVGRDGGTTFVDLRSGQVVARVEIGCDVLGAARAGGSDVLLACSDGCVRWLDASARVVHKTMRVDDEGIFAVALSPDGQTLAAGGHLHLTVLEAATGRLVARRSHRKSVGVVQFLFGGRCLMTNDEDASTRLWDASSWQYSGTLAPLDVDGEGISTSSDGLRLAQRSHKRVRILDLRP